MKVGRPSQSPSPELVQALVVGISEMANIPKHLVFAEDQRRAVVWARAMVCRWLRAHEDNYSTPGIGHELNIHHTTVLNLLRCRQPPHAPALIKRAPTRKPKPEVVIEATPHRYKRTGQRIMDHVNRYGAGKKIYTEEIAARFNISPDNAAHTLSNLHNTGRLCRVRPGVYVPASKPDPAPVAITQAVIPSASFIRPISKERMMAGR